MLCFIWNVWYPTFNGMIISEIFFWINFAIVKCYFVVSVFDINFSYRVRWNLKFNLRKCYDFSMIHALKSSENKNNNRFIEHRVHFIPNTFQVFVRFRSWNLRQWIINCLKNGKFFSKIYYTAFFFEPIISYISEIQKVLLNEFSSEFFYRKYNFPDDWV